MDDKLYDQLPADGWLAGPRNLILGDHATPKPKLPNYKKVCLCQEHITRELRATVWMFPETESGFR